MRRAVLALLATAVATGLLAAPAGAATTCTPPRMPGFKVLALRASSLSCKEAQRLMRNVINGQQMRPYGCTRDPRDVPILGVECRKGEHRFSGRYRPA
jgi:hypothetical protein